MSSRYNFTEEEYENLKKLLNPQELKEIEQLERDCADLTVDYWEFYIKTGKENYKPGICWIPERLEKLHATPMYKLRMCLLYRAACRRGIITG